MLLLPMPSTVVMAAPCREQMGVRQALTGWCLQVQREAHVTNYTTSRDKGTEHPVGTSRGQAGVVPQALSLRFNLST